VDPQWLLADLSWYRIVHADWWAVVGIAGDYGLLGGDTRATSLGGVVRLNYADWITLSARLGTVVGADGQPEGGFNATIGIGIEPRLWCEHITRQECEPSWFITSLLQ
jgi:hypothetical protein